MSGSILPRLRYDQRGFTLVELLIASGLMVLVATIIGGILFNSLNAEKTVRTTTQAASQGQLVATSIQNGVRNATWLSPLVASGDFLAVRTASGAESVTYSCQAWFITGGTAYMRISNTAITRPTTSNLTGWTQLATGLTKAGAEFIVWNSSRQVTITFEVSAGDAQPVLISTSALSRQSAEQAGSCA